MAEHSVGKIYVELDLDPSRYMRGQQTLLKEAQNGAKILEKNFHNLNIKSDATYDLMRAQAEQSFMRIKKAHNTTVDDMVRAEKAKAEKIRQINEQQYGHQKTIFSNLKNHWKSLSVVAIAATTAAAYQIQKIGFEAIKVASDLEEVTSKFNTVFKGQQTQAEEWAKVLVDSYAMSTRESKQYLSSVQDLLVPMGMQAEAAALMSNEVVKLSADLGSFNNLPTAKVMDDIQSALVGNYETMKKYGVVLTATRVQERALADGLAESKDALTAADKAQTAYKLIVEGSTAAIGDMARTSDGYANQTKKLEANIEDLKAMLGNELLPTATDIVSKMNEWIAANNEFINQKVSETVEDIGNALKTIVGIYKGLPDGVIGAAGVGIVGRILTGSTPIAQATAAIVLLNTQLKAIDMDLASIAKKSSGAWDNIVNIWDVITGKRDAGTGTLTGNKSGMGAMLEGLGDIADVILPDLIVNSKALGEEYEILTEGMEAFADLMTGDMDRAFTDYLIANLDDATKGTKKLTETLEKLKKAALAKEIAKAWKVQDISDWVRAGNQAIEDMEREFGIYMDGVYRDIENTDAKVVEDVRKTTDLTYDLWMRAMNRVEEGIADTFYEVFTGQFDSIEDAFDSMLDSMLRMLAEWAAAATMFDLFGKGDGSASWGGFFSSVFGSGGSTSGVWGNGSSGGGWMDWVGTLFSAGKSGYELYTGESLMGQVYNFAAESLASIFAEAAGGAYVGMYAEVTMAEVEAMVAAELAATEGIGAGASVGAGSAGAWVGGAYAAAAMALILGITAVFENNTMKNDANMTVAFGAKISELYNRLFDLEFLSVIFNDGFDQADAETEAMSLFNEIAGTFGAFEKIWSVLSEESQRELKESMKAINWDDFVITIQAVATANGEAQRIIGMMGSEGFKDWISAGMPKSDGKPWTEGDNKYDDYWDEFMHAGYPNSGMDYYAEAATATDILWDVIHEYFQPYLAEAVQGIMDFDVYQYMSDEFKTSVESLLTDEAWSNGVDAYFQTFSDNIDKIYAAAAAYDDFNNFIDGSTDKYTEQSRAIALATAATAAQVALLESMGHELSEEGIQELATMWAQYYANLSDDLSALAEPVTMLDQAVAAYTAQFETYWQQMIDAGIDVEKLGDKTQIFDDAVKDLIQTLQTAVWDEIEKSVKALNSEIGSTETAVTNLVSVFTEMWQALVQVNAASEDFVSLQQMALETMKYQMGLGDGFDRAGQIEDRYGRYGLSYQQMINAFANMDLDGLMAIAGELGIDWWDIADDVAWMIDQLEGAGEAATIAATDFTALRSSIEATLSGISGSFGGSDSAAMIMSQITGMQSIPMSEMTGDTLLSMSEKLVQWYNAAVSEAQAVANEENAAAQLLIQVSDRLESLVSQIDSTIRSIKFSTLNVAIPGVKAVEAQGDYNKLLAAAQSGGTSEINEYLGFAQTYLQQQQNAYKSSETYQGLYATVMADMEAIKSKAEAGGYDAQILAELQSGHETIDADLSGIQATFSEFEGWILNALTTMENIDLAISINWDDWDGDQADALRMLLSLVEVYGWDHEYTLKFLADVPMNIFTNLDDLAHAAGWIADNSGGWNSKATIAFLKNVAANWGFENLQEILTSVGFVAKQAGSWTADATIEFIAALMDRYGTPLADMPYWLDLMGVGEEIPAVMAKLVLKAYGGAIPIDDIDDYLTDIGIVDANLSRNIKINLIYDMVSSGDLDFKDVATYAYNQAYAAWIMAPGTPEAVSILYDLKALGQMWGSKNAYNLGTGVNLYGGYTSSIQSWMDLFNRHGVSGTGWKYGGMAYGPESGYYAQLHGNELIVSPKEGYPATVLSNGGSTQAGANRDQEVALLKEQNRLLRQIANQDLKIKGMNKYMRATAEDVDVERANRGKSASKERYVS